MRILDKRIKILVDRHVERDPSSLWLQKQLFDEVADGILTDIIAIQNYDGPILTHDVRKVGAISLDLTCSHAT